MSFQAKFGAFCRKTLSSLIVFSALFVSACSTTDGELPPAHTIADTAVDAVEYRIGPLDTLQIFVWRNPELNVELTVRPDGKISLPLVDALPAAGRTANELAADIEAVLSDTIRNPEVSVMTMSFNGTFGQQVRVIGEAAEPQALQFRANMTLVDVMILVGGLTEYAAGNRARLIRYVDGSKREYRIRLGNLVNNGDMDANVRIEPGDVIVIPETVF